MRITFSVISFPLKCQTFTYKYIYSSTPSVRQSSLSRVEILDPVIMKWGQLIGESVL